MLIAIPQTAITGKTGTLKVRSKPGCLILRIQTAIQTIVKNKVQTHISANLLIGVKAATVAINPPKIIKFVLAYQIKD
jgi:hypothetical protein